MHPVFKPVILNLIQHELVFYESCHVLKRRQTQVCVRVASKVGALMRHFVPWWFVVKLDIVCVLSDLEEAVEVISAFSYEFKITEFFLNVSSDFNYEI